MSDPYQPDQPGQQPGYQTQPGYPAQPGYPPQPHQPQGGYPGYGYAPPYGYPPADPGQTMGIVGFVLAFVFPPAGIVFAAIGRSQSRQAGFDNQLAAWGFWLSIVFTSLGVLYALFWVLLVFGGLFAAVSVGGATSAVGLTV